MNRTLEINTVCSCNKLFNKKVLHPLVSVIPLSNEEEKMQLRLDCYSVLLLRFPADTFLFGRQKGDFSDGSLLFCEPSKLIDLSDAHQQNADGSLLLFHPDIVCGTSLGCHMRDYSFLFYKPEEALHLAACELKTLKRCLHNIEKELLWGVDDFSKIILCNQIELFLNYCRRFYARQFITRQDDGLGIIQKVDSLLDEYFLSGDMAVKGLPSAYTLNAEIGTSAHYLEDLLKTQTGKNFYDYTQLRRIKLVEQQIKNTDKTVDDIARNFGFCSEECLTKLFKKITGQTPAGIRLNQKAVS